MTAGAVFQILGGLGVFLFGLRIMSQALQQVAGDRMRAILHGMTRNRFAGVFSGFLITTAIQSSSATTVLVVSFANAGLLSLLQSIGLVMGANIGTTVTGWLVALLGFKVKISAFALPLIGVAFPLSLLSSRRLKGVSEVFVGFGLLFLGLSFLKDGVPDLKSNPEALAFLQQFTDAGFLSILAFIVVGSVLTVTVQSSSASMAITLAMAAKGWIGFDIAAAMVLGENIGTTITAQLAAIGASRNARRVAMSHTIFNLIGVLWILPLMGLFLSGVDWIVPGDPWTLPADDASAITYAGVVTAHLAAFHTAFNIINTSVLLGFVNQLSRLVRWLIPIKDVELERAHLEFLETGLMGTPELAAESGRRALLEMVGVAREMGELVGGVVRDPSMRLDPTVTKIRALEDKLDRMEEEVVEYCGGLARSEISEDLGHAVPRYVEMSGEIEEIGDHWLQLARLLQKQADTGHGLNPKAWDQLQGIMAAAREILDKLHWGLEIGNEPDFEAIAGLAKRGKLLAKNAREASSEGMQGGSMPVRDGIVYLDLVARLTELIDNAVQVAQTGSQLESGGVRTRGRSSTPARTA